MMFKWAEWFIIYAAIMIFGFFLFIEALGGNVATIYMTAIAEMLKEAFNG